MNIREVTISHTLIYDQDSYLDWCEVCDETPTDEGFLQWVRGCADEDFNGGVLFDNHILKY